MHVTKKKIWWMLLSALTLSFVLVIGSLGLAAGRSGTAQAHSSRTSAAESSSSGYVLGVYEGQLALFREHSRVPYQRLDMPLSMLSAYDREQVEQGIVVQTQEELRKLLEDLTS